MYRTSNKPSEEYAKARFRAIIEEYRAGFYPDQCAMWKEVSKAIENLACVSGAQMGWLLSLLDDNV